MKDSEPDTLPAIARAVSVAIAAIAALALVPGLAAGLAAGGALRRRRLSWSWSLIGLAIVAAPVLVLAEPARSHAGALLEQTLAAHPRPQTVLIVLAPLWLLSGPLACGMLMLWRAHRDRLHGGHAEQHAKDALGPLDTWRLRRAQRTVTTTGTHSHADGLLLGQDARGRPVRVPCLKAHAMFVGGSNTGKTNTAEVLIEGHVAGGSAVVILDGKGGQDLPRAAIELGARYQRPVALWSISPYGAPELDELRLPWSVTGDGNPTEIKDRIATTEEQENPYYKSIASYGLLAACQALTLVDGHVRLDRLAAVMTSVPAFKALLRTTDPDRFSHTLTWLQGLTETERSGLSGMALRLDTMIASDGGEQLLPGVDGREINLYRSVTEGWLTVFTLAEGTYPNLIPHVARYVLQTLNAVCTRIETSGRHADAIVFVDELSAFDGDQLASGFERGRSAGVRYCVATQSLSNFAAAGGDKLMDAALDNSELIVIHRQTVPEAAERLAGVGGTEEAWEHTHKVSDAPGIGTAIGSRLGLDEPGERARRLTDRFRVHPNDIKQLPQGHAFVIQHRPTHTVTRVHIRPGLTAEHPATAATPRPPPGSCGPRPPRRAVAVAEAPSVPATGL